MKRGRESDRDPPSAPVKTSTAPFAPAVPGLEPRRAAEIRVKREMSVTKSLSATLNECARHIRANVAGVRRGQDP